MLQLDNDNRIGGLTHVKHDNEMFVQLNFESCLQTNGMHCNRGTETQM